MFAPQEAGWRAWASFQEQKSDVGATQGGYTSGEILIFIFQMNQNTTLTCTGHLTQGAGPDRFVSAAGELCG